MHGVQPKAKAMPITGGAQTPSLDARGWNLRSRWKSRGVPMPASQIPRTTMTTPAAMTKPR